MRYASRTAAIGLLLLSACGNPKSEAQAHTKLDEVAKRDPTGARATAGPRPTWQREATPMPATFAGFPRPDLPALDGAWIVDAAQPSGAIVWLIEAEASKLTTIDPRGQERIFGLTLSSPCALRLTDSSGRSSTRAVAQVAGELIITSKGAVAIAGKDGSLLACVGTRTYQIASDGQCRYTTDLLGVWSDPIEAVDICKLETIAGERVLTIAKQTLRERDGVWLDELAGAGVLQPSAGRAEAIASITPKPEPSESETAGTTETGETG